jgi:GT2 family glycosyltransferase
MTRERVDISIVIFNWNAREYLFKCLDSILETEEGRREGIIIIDKASYDGCRNEIKEKFPKVHLIENERTIPNGGS